jgi:hypothetical protein
MQYLLMCCIDEALWAKLPDSEAGQAQGGSIEVRPVLRTE